MKMKKINKSLAILLTGSMILCNVLPVSAAESQTEAVYSKYENVYAKLSAEGVASDAYVVNHFSVKEAGDIVDYGNYETVKNLTTLNEMQVNRESVGFYADGGEFYYQGQMENAELPWKFSIRYELDGKSVTCEELAGKDGRLKIIFQSEKNEKVKGDFYDNYLMQISVTLNCEKAANIVADGATVADAGADRQLSFTVLPGSDADFTVEADVKDFSMSGFSIAAVPYNMSIDMEEFNTDDFTDQISELTDAVDKLNDGTESLNRGMRELCDNNGEVLDGSQKLQDGIRELSNNSATIRDASRQIKNALNTISTQLQDADFSDLSKLAELPGGLNKLADALDGIQNGLTTLNTSYTQAYAVLDQTMQSGTATLDNMEWAALQDSVSGNDAAVAAYQKLSASYQQLQIILATYQKIKPAFEAISGTLGSDSSTSVVNGIHTVSSNIRGIAGSLSKASETDIAGQMNTLKNGLNTLASQYGEFHNGLTSYTEGIDTLSGNYGTFQDGIASYLDGTVKLKDGTAELSDGMEQFADGIRDMPTEIQNTIDEMVESFSGNDYQAVSYTDSRNENIVSVQFVISTKGIEKAKTEKAVETDKKEGFLDRLKALFTR